MFHVCVCARSLQLCLTLCDLRDCSPPGSSVHEILQAGEYWSGFPCPPPGDLANPGIKPMSPALQADSLLLRHWGSLSCSIGYDNFPKMNIKFESNTI